MNDQIGSLRLKWAVAAAVAVVVDVVMMAEGGNNDGS